MSLHPPDAQQLHSLSTSQRHFPSPDFLEDPEGDTFDPFSIDPELRLRTVRTAHSVIAESIRCEAHAQRRKSRRRLFSGIKRKASTVNAQGFKESLRKRTTSVAETVDEHIIRNHGGHPTPSRTAPLSPKKPDVRDKGKGKAHQPERRTVYVNLPLPAILVHPSNDPIIRYVRNKVRTTKYTIVTFLPKNLYEQFRRVANIYFLALVVLQVFSIFGATNAQIGMLPLLAILGMTAIKDGVEDWRRAKLDNEVNNAATTKLGEWRNVNQPSDSRSFWERLLRLGPGASVE